MFPYIPIYLGIMMLQKFATHHDLVLGIPFGNNGMIISMLVIGRTIQYIIRKWVVYLFKFGLL
jgi:hypothetical protein